MWPSVHLSIGLCTRIFFSSRAGMDRLALPGLHQEGRVATEPSRPQPSHHVWGAMLQMYKTYTPKPTNKAEIKPVLEAIRENFVQNILDQVELAFWKKLQACIQAEAVHFEHLLK